MLMFRERRAESEGFGPLAMRELCTAEPGGGRALPKGRRAAEGTIAGAPLADPTACRLTPKDDLCLQAAGKLLLFNLFQYMW